MRREQEKLEHGVQVECKDAIEKAIAEKFDGCRNKEHNPPHTGQ